MINPASKLAQAFWERGRLPDCPVFNFHAHMHDAAGLYMPRSRPEDMLRSMDAANCLISFFCSHPAMLNPTLGPEQDMAVVRRWPGRFKAYHAVVSRHLDADADLRRVAAHPDVFVGFKFHGDWYETPITDPRHQPYWEYADEHGLLVLCHTWGTSANDGPDQAAAILGRYRNLVFIGAHGFHDAWPKAAEIANAFPNYYFDLTGIIDDRGPLDRFLADARGGSRQVLFGTDLPWFSLHHGIGGVLAADMTDEDRRNIFYRNGARLLGRFDWFRKLWAAQPADGGVIPLAC